LRLDPLLNGGVSFVGMLLVAVLLVFNFVVDLAAAVRGLISASKAFSALIYAFAGVTLTLFLFVFYRDRAR
jgi:hypothetical protein